MDATARWAVCSSSQGPISNPAEVPIIMDKEPLSLLRLLLARLERISADSYWAHRASGVRGSLIKLAEQIDTGASISPKELSERMEMGFIIMEQAALKKRIQRNPSDHLRNVDDEKENRFYSAK
jgi:hypothetical protein